MNADNGLSFAGKNAFIAGGTSGINLAFAEALSAAGANVAVLSRSQDKVDAAIEGLQAIAGGNAKSLGFACDVREYDGVAAALQDASNAFGPLDCVVSGAAGNFLCPAENLSANGFKTVIDIDLIGTFNVLRAAFDVARKPGASFINISAPQSTMPFWGQAHVCSAKAGIDMLTKSLAFEWGPTGIRVNAIVPGPISETEGMERLTATPELRKAVENSVALRRYGEKSDIAEMALFLASDKARYVTGSIMACDGGQVLAGGASMHPDTMFAK